MPSPPGGWDFSPGNSIRDEVNSHFGTPVHFSSSFNSSPFRLVLDLHRASFRLTTSSVALALRAAIGGSPVGFHVQHLVDRSFSFVVCSKAIGLWISVFVSSFGRMGALIGIVSLIFGRKNWMMNGLLFSVGRNLQNRIKTFLLPQSFNVWNSLHRLLLQRSPEIILVNGKVCMMILLVRIVI